MNRQKIRIMIKYLSKVVERYQVNVPFLIFKL